LKNSDHTFLHKVSSSNYFNNVGIICERHKITILKQPQLLFEVNSSGNLSSTHHHTECRMHSKCDGTCAETRFRLSAKWTSPFKSAGGVSSVAYWQPRCAHQP